MSLLRLDLSHATVSAAHGFVTVAHVRAYLTKTAATALNATLGTTVFAPGLKLGSRACTPTWPARRPGVR